MYFFNKVNFSDNMYKIRRNDEDFHAEVTCSLHSNIYCENNKYFIDLLFEKNKFVAEIKQLENAIESSMNCSLNNKLNANNILKHVKIPYKYNRISLNMYDKHNNKITSHELVAYTQCKIHLLANYVYVHNKTGGIVWSIHKVVVM